MAPWNVNHAAVVLVCTAACVLAGVAVLSRRKKQRPRVFLRGADVWQQVQLQSKRTLTHNTREFVFVFPENVPFGLPVGRHIQIRHGTDKKCVRSYTPVECGNGYFKLVAKIYEQGEMTQFLDALSEGDKITLRGPTGRHEYLGEGTFGIAGRKQDTLLHASRFALISGGTGLTPMLQVIYDVLKRRAEGSDKEPKLSLLQAHSTPKDVILREDMEALQDDESNDVEVVLTASRFDSEEEHKVWPHAEGRISAEMLQPLVQGHNDDTLALVCGPPGFVKAAKHALLEELKMPRNRVLVF
ncbi:MAG: hypothetical protein MHM6MM_007162 [Cercozoa sp. M6MM]